ncbi:MAG: F0F1 ATP synthase subunit B [Leucobacter sp.]
MLKAFILAAEEGSSHSVLLPSAPDLIYGTLAFLVVLAVLVWKVLPNVYKALDARRDAIEGGIQRADEAQAKAEAALQEYTAQLAGAREEAGEIRDAARADAAKIVAKAKEDASHEAARIAQVAQAQIEAERQSAVTSLRKDVGSLAIDLASGVVGEQLANDKNASALVDRFIADLEAAEKAAK